MSLTFSVAALVAGASDYTELGSARSPLPKSIPGDALCSEPDGASPSVTTFASSPRRGSKNVPGQTDLFSYADRLPAKSTAQQITAEAGSTPTTSSLKPSASQPSLDLLGLRLRTLLASELEAMTGSRMNWKPSVSPAGRSWWVLQMPAQPIGARGSGSYALTPTETGNLACDSMDKGKGGWGHFIPMGRANKGGLPDSHGKLPGFVPTPAAQTGPKKGHPEVGGGGSGACKAAEMFFPTVTAQDYGSNVGGAAGRTGTKRLSLSSLARSLGLSGRQFLASIYENMMGFPPGWLSSVALLTETQSLQSFPNSSDAQS